MSGGGQPDDMDTRADLGKIGVLVTDLASDDGSVRENARLSLVGIGGRAVAALIDALGDPRRQVRWEAAKALEQIADPKAALALVGALEDKEFSVRWLAAEGLIALESKGLVPLLRALIERSDSAWLREGAHHVLHDLHNVSGRRLREVLEPLLAALEDVEPVLEVPPAAETALEALTKGGRQRGRRENPGLSGGPKA
jgi:HEAT repeat protein